MKYKKHRHQKISLKKIKIKKNYFLWAITVFFIVSCIYITIQTASAGARLMVLEKEESKLISENQKISAEIIKASSLMKAEEKAMEIGFVKPQNTIYITGEEFVARLP